jgi:ABC-2 type transport system ATP-binding protein
MIVYDVQDLTKQYPKQATPANAAISFQIEAGEIFGLLGDNGAGKTSLVRQMANLLAPTSGSIRLFGQPLAQNALHVPQQIGFMPQGAQSLNSVTVGEALYFVAHLRGLSRGDARAERERLVDLLQLGDFRGQAMNRLSGGQRRLAVLATTLVASPPVLILDEPTNDLSPQNRVHVWDVLRQINHEQGTTIILVTHNVLEAEKVIQRVGIMKAGKLIALGRPGALKAELGDQLRLEVIFTPGCLPQLPPDAHYQQKSPDRWSLLINQRDAPRYLDIITQQDAIEDFRLSTPSLEDLYMSLMA